MEIVEIIKLGGPVVGVVAIFAWLIYKLVCKILPVADRLGQSVSANTKATTEMHEFLRNLNGKLRRGIKAIKKNDT